MKLRERKKKKSQLAEGEVEKTGRTTQPEQKKPRISEDVTTSSRKSTTKNTTTDCGDGAKASAPSLSKVDPQDFIDSIQDESKRADVQELHNLVTRYAPTLEPTLEFDNKLAYGKYHYKYKSGREGDWYRIAIACGGKDISFHFCAMKEGSYVMEWFIKNKKSLGKAKTGKSCARFKKLDDLDRDALIALIEATATADLMT